MTPEGEPELEDDYFEDDPDSDIICWVCYCCNHTESKRPAWGGECPRCGSIMNEEPL